MVISYEVERCRTESENRSSLVKSHDRVALFLRRPWRRCPTITVPHFQPVFNRFLLLYWFIWLSSCVISFFRVSAAHNTTAHSVPCGALRSASLFSSVATLLGTRMRCWFSAPHFWMTAQQIVGNYIALGLEWKKPVGESRAELYVNDCALWWEDRE